MADVYDYFLHKLQASTPEVFFVEIGAMDGVTFDPIAEYVKKFHWSGVLVEPLPDQYEQLRKNYSGHCGVRFENCAITEQRETRAMLRVAQNAVREGKVPEWAQGISSFFNDRNAIGGLGCAHAEFDTLRPHILSQPVTCMTLRDLLERHQVARIDLLQIDTEGYDFRVLRQLDFSRFRPKIINLEYGYLPNDEKVACIDLLQQQGYRCYQHEAVDLVATIFPE